MSVDEAAKNGKKGSMAPKDMVDIQPVVYSFKGPAHSQLSGSVMTAARPPQWLYHDHVMGVIWMIFHKAKNYVGISQLQWCLKFLLDLKNSDGEYTGDVEICIQAVQDDLIEQYARLGPVLEKSIEEKSSREDKQRSVVPENMPSNIITESEATTENQPPPENNDAATPVHDEAIPESVNTPKTGDTDGEKDNFFTAQAQGITGTSTPKKDAQHIPKQDATNKYFQSNCGAKCAPKGAKRKTQDIVSFTYNEMVSRGPAPCTEPHLIDETYNEQGTNRGNLRDMNSEALLTFLAASRRQQVDRINRETETLRVLERMMKNINVNGSVANNIEDLAIHLENLQTEDVTHNEDITTLHN